MLIAAHVRAQPAGFTLIEVMIAISVAALLLVLVVPSMRVLVENSRMRAAAESLKYGLDLARNEAVRLNTQVEFCRGAEGWFVRRPFADDTCAQADAPNLHSGTGREGSTDFQVTITPNGADRVTFDSFGRVVAANANGSVPLTRLDVESSNPPTSNAYRPMSVQLLGGGIARLCDPAVPTSDTRTCL